MNFNASVEQVNWLTQQAKFGYPVFAEHLSDVVPDEAKEHRDKLYATSALSPGTTLSSCNGCLPTSSVREAQQQVAPSSRRTIACMSVQTPCERAVLSELGG